MHTYEGHLIGTGLKFGIVVARWNEFIGGHLLAGALDALRRHGVEESNIEVAWCPGAFEIPLIARRMAACGRYDGIITLGAVIRGSTSHYDIVANGVAGGVASAMNDTGVPILLGVLTTDTIEQAIERAGTKAGNKGAECAVAAIEMANLLRQLDGTT